MGKRIEKAFGRGDKSQTSASHHDDEDPNRTPEPYLCSGHFQNDFTELCRRNAMYVIPPILPRPRRPVSPSMMPAVEDSKSRPGKKDAGKNQPPPEPETETPVDEHGEPTEPPPKTYVTKEKFGFFKPCVQVEMDNPDKQETVSEVYVRGWKIDEAMMTIFKQCWTKLDRLSTIDLWNTGLADDTLEMLASILPECPNLKILTLDNNPVPGEAWHLLIKEESPLQQLSVRYNAITDKGAELLGKALGNTTIQNTKLLSLNLNGNKITDAGVQHLATGLRMNRTLLSLSLCNNQVSDQGAQKLAEVLSRFTLTHEEVVERRKLLTSASDRKSASPLPGSKRSDSRDRPGSVRSSHAGQTKGKSAKAKKDGKEKEEKHDTKGKGKKEPADKGAKKGSHLAPGASIVADAGKTVGKKSDKGKKKGPTQPEQEVMDAPEVQNPLLDSVEHLDNGVLLLRGNHNLIHLNLSHNSIGEEGLKSLLLAVGYQSSISEFQGGKVVGNGLMRLNLSRNAFSPSSDAWQKLQTLMLPKDPFYKPQARSPDQESTNQ